MLKRKLTLPEICLVIINLLPILGVWFQGWDPARIFLFYCLETILIGIFHAIKMIIVLILSETPEDIPMRKHGGLLIAGIFLVGFFILHYGIFVFVQTSMFFAISGIYRGEFTDLNIIILQQLLGKEGILMIAIFIGYYILDNVKQLITLRIQKSSDLAELMFQPYIRIFIQQFVLLFGSMFLAFKLGHVFIVIFIFIRLFIEIYMNRRTKVNDSLEKSD